MDRDKGAGGAASLEADDVCVTVQIRADELQDVIGLISEARVELRRLVRAGKSATIDREWCAGKIRVRLETAAETETRHAAADQADRDKAIRLLRDAATGKVAHVYAGCCPNVAGEGKETEHDRADPSDRCVVCDALRVVEREVSRGA